MKIAVLDGKVLGGKTIDVNQAYRPIDLVNGKKDEELEDLINKSYETPLSLWDMYGDGTYTLTHVFKGDKQLVPESLAVTFIQSLLPNELSLSEAYVQLNSYHKHYNKSRN